jgi:hypothetical protein
MSFITDPSELKIHNCVIPKDVKIEYGTVKRFFNKKGILTKEDVLWLNGKEPTKTQIRAFKNPFDDEIETIIQIYHEGKWRTITRIEGYRCVYEIGGRSVLVQFYKK